MVCDHRPTEDGHQTISVGACIQELSNQDLDLESPVYACRRGEMRSNIRSHSTLC
jgi:hypothetical protein